MTREEGGEPLEGPYQGDRWDFERSRCWRSRRFRSYVRAAEESGLGVEQGESALDEAASSAAGAGLGLLVQARSRWPSAALPRLDVHPEAIPARAHQGGGRFPIEDMAGAGKVVADTTCDSTDFGNIGIEL